MDLVSGLHGLISFFLDLCMVLVFGLGYHVVLFLLVVLYMTVVVNFMSFVNNFLCLSSCMGFLFSNFKFHAWGSCNMEVGVVGSPRNPKKVQCLIE